MLLLSIFLACGDDHSHDDEDFAHIMELESNIDRGAELYADNCSSCHGENGEGIPFVGPNIKTYSDDLVLTVLKDGKKGIIGAMPDFEGRLTENHLNNYRHETKEDGLSSYCHPSTKA